MRGQLLVLDMKKIALDELIEWLWEREGKPARERLKQTACGDFGCVLYCDLESNLRNEEINAESLAGFAIESVRKNPTRNAISYLAQNIEQGVITPLTYAYRDAILHRVGAVDLTEAEKVILRSVHGV